MLLAFVGARSKVPMSFTFSENVIVSYMAAECVQTSYEGNKS
jgi:hypothetical protein